jgi:hypothetical protein
MPYAVLGTFLAALLSCQRYNSVGNGNRAASKLLDAQAK